MKKRLSHYIYKGNQEYKIELYYTKGGVNYLTGNNIPRGYCISVTPVTRKFNSYASFGKPDEGYWSESSVMFQGVKGHVQTAQRFSQKTFDKIAENWLSEHEVKIYAMIHFCVTKGWVTEAA